MLHFQSLRRWCSRKASDRDRPCATLRISLNPVRWSIVQDLRLLPIDSSLVSRSPSLFFFLSVLLADKCVFQVMSINKSMSSNKKLLSLVKLVKLFVFAFKNATLRKISGAQRPPDPTYKAPPFPAGYVYAPGSYLELWRSRTTQFYTGQFNLTSWHNRMVFLQGHGQVSMTKPAPDWKWNRLSLAASGFSVGLQLCSWIVMWEQQSLYGPSLTAARA